MRKGAVILAIALVAGAVAFYMMRSRKMDESRGLLMDSMPELAWVRKDLELTDEQFAKVSNLHSAYRPKCMEMCRRVSAAHEKLDGLAIKVQFQGVAF